MHEQWNQRLRPLDGLPPGSLRIYEIFRTIQGESTFAGLSCTMVRTTGCNLRCTYCDTRNAFAGGSVMSIDEVVSEVEQLGLDLVEVTGGEPLAQPATPDLLTELCDTGRTVLLETGGSLPIDTVDPRVVRIVDFKAPSSGEVDANLWENVAVLRRHDQVKLVLGDRADYEWARAVIAEHDLAAQATVLVGAVWDTLEPGTLAEWVLADQLPVRLQVQLHKVVGLP